MKPVRAFIAEAPALTISALALVAGVIQAFFVYWPQPTAGSVCSVILMVAGVLVLVLCLCSGMLPDAWEAALRARRRRYWARPGKDGRIEICTRGGGTTQTHVVYSFDVSEDEAAADRLRELRHRTATEKVDLTEAKSKAKMLNRVTR